MLKGNVEMNGFTLMSWTAERVSTTGYRCTFGERDREGHWEATDFDMTASAIDPGQFVHMLIRNGQESLRMRRASGTL